MDKLYIIKIGGNVIDNAESLQDFLTLFASLQGNRILVHGGGKLATSMAEKLQVPQQMIDGRRITDKETLKVVTMVYAGLVNKDIVAGLQSNGCNAIGLCGADGNAILAHKRMNAKFDYGFAGDIDEVNTSLISSLLAAGLTPVFSPVTHDRQGQLLNTNADTIAQEIAKAMSSAYDVTLIYTFEKKGVLENIENENSVIATITIESFGELKAKEKIFAGMLPKLDNAFAAISSGVSKVIIGNAGELQDLVNGKSGTAIIHG